LEHGIRFQEKVLNVFEPNPELYEVNPLARVPVFRSKAGEVVIESDKILAFLYRSLPQSPLLPREDQEWLEVARWSALAVGLAEKTVEFYLETLRPEGARDAELLQEVQEIAERVLARLNASVGDRDTILPGKLTQADLDLGTALAYLSLRYPAFEWKKRYPRAEAYFQKQDARPSFLATRPPA
jgi:glutathione S-transferase